MNISKKGLFGIILIVAILTSSLAYALLQVYYEIPTVHVTVRGIGLQVYNWSADPDTLGALCTAIDFNMLDQDVEGFSQKIVLVADCYGYDMSIGWTTDLDPAVGTIGLQVEQVELLPVSGYYNQTLSQDGLVMAGSEKIGLKKLSDAVEGDYGHLWVTITILPDAPYGIHDFSITFIDTQV